MLRFITIVLLVLYPTTLWGNDPLCEEQVYDNRDEPPNFECPSPGESALVQDLGAEPSVPLEAGEEFTAYWDGAFVHRDRLIEIGLRIKAIRRLRWSDRVLVADEKRLQLEHASRTAAIRLESARERIEHYREALSEANSRTEKAQAWYRSWVFGFLVGVVSVGIISALGIYMGVAL